MTQNVYRVPLLIATILEGISLLVFISCVSAQEQICALMIAPGTGGLPHVVPVVELGLRVVYFALCLILLLIANSYKGESRRGIAAVFAVLRCIFMLSAPYLAAFSTRLVAMKGEKELIVYSSVTQGFNLVATPFLAGATAFFFIGLGRYGIATIGETE
ncbi:MAG: hypothetical protein K6E50_03125 [Lachnospiraceae bacterium]|nr:hypothetical protein [Lachnospiraceae bacterium]